jgi:hypothetical protein
MNPPMLMDASTPRVSFCGFPVQVNWLERPVKKPPCVAVASTEAKSPAGHVRAAVGSGDLIYTFGWALWTGVVVVVFVQIWPEAKRRQFKQALDAYEASVSDQARGGDGQASNAAGAGERSPGTI